MLMRRFSRTVIVTAACLMMTAGAWSQDREPHPLETHMKHWIAGSARLRAPNPGYKADNPRSFKEYEIHWEWASDHRHMVGEILAIRADGSSARVSTMYMFYNPGNKTVQFTQVGWRGHFAVGEHPARTTPLPYGEVELHETTDYTPDGKTTTTRHANSFYDDGSHKADVYRLKDGEWVLQRQWEWMRVSERTDSSN